MFFVQVLGFQRIQRPSSFDSFDGAWVCGLGLEIHFIQKDNISDSSCRSVSRLDNITSDQPIDPSNDHL